MKYVENRKYAFTLLPALVGLGIMGVQPAEAKWTLYTEGSGTNTTTCTDCGHSVPVGSGAWGEPHAQIDQLPANKEGSAKTSGTVTLKFKWTADYPGQEMPKTVKVLVSADAAAGEHHPAHQGEDYVSAEIKVSNDLGGEEKNEDNFNWMNVYTKTAKRAKVLRTLDVSSEGIAKVDINLSASVKATAKSYIWSMLSAGVSATMAEDNRSVKIIRENAVGDWEDNDGTVHGHSTYSYWYYENLGDTQKKYSANSQKFIAHYTFPGTTGQGWQGVKSWSWNPQGQTDTQWDKVWETYPTSLTLNALGIWEGTVTGPSDKTITYTVTDADDATADAKYILHLHDEVEKVSDSTSPVSVQEPLWGSNPLRNDGSVMIITGYAAPNTRTANAGYSSSTGWTFVGGSEFQLPRIAKPLGISVEYNTTNQYSINGSSTCHFEVPEDYYAYPAAVHAYSRHTTIYRHFGPSGEHINALAPGEMGPPTPHMVIWDKYAGGDIKWIGPLFDDGNYPVRDPQAPPIRPDHPAP